MPRPDYRKWTEADLEAAMAELGIHPRRERNDKGEEVLMFYREDVDAAIERYEKRTGRKIPKRWPTRSS